MGKKLYVGNLAYSVRDEELQLAFSAFGAVQSAKVMMDRDTGRSKGFGFVEMGSDAEAQAAINGLNGQALSGRAVVVNEARPREERPSGFRSPYGSPRREGSSGGGYGAGGGGGGGYGGGGGGRTDRNDRGDRADRGDRGGYGGGGFRSPYGNRRGGSGGDQGGY